MTIGEEVVGVAVGEVLTVGAVVGDGGGQNSDRGGTELSFCDFYGRTIMERRERNEK